jgi:hypothetical protein
MMIGFSCCHRRYRETSGEHNEFIENFEAQIDAEEAREAEEALAENPDGRELCTRDFARRLLRWFCAFVASTLFGMGLYMFYTTSQPGFTLGLTCLAMQSPNSSSSNSFKSCTVTAVIIGFWLVLTGPVLLLVEFRSK